MAQDAGETVDVLVIGAGMAGLIAAAELQRAGRRVLVLDKGRGAGAVLAAGNIDSRRSNIDSRRSTGRSASANIAG